MKKQLLSLALISSLFTGVQAQTVADFENLSLEPNSAWSGTASSADSSFTSGNAIFPNSYSGYWAKGWAYSNKSDSTTAGYANLTASRAGSGYNQSAHYAVGQNNAIVKLTEMSVGAKVNGFYITNGTYAALSMAAGDNFAKKFGGASGNEADWFLLTIKGYSNGTITSDSVDFYLADFRFEDNMKDYIVKDWRWVDVSSLGNVDSLVFSMTSSDVGAWGMNTPAFFCLDNFTTEDKPTSVIAVQENDVQVFPNPASEVLNVTTVESTGGTISVIDVLGNVLLTQNIVSDITTLAVSNLKQGVYLINVYANESVVQKRFVKK